ncbi:MAG: hypothetical protein KF773_34055 [Deltaproteobacteria bacterium]|nr:hypothetical protein [Deltaproteobacteria bacterium]
MSRHRWDPRPRERPVDDIDIDEARPNELALPGGLEMRAPIVDGRLTVIPIVAAPNAPPPAARTFITLAEGMASGAVTVREVAHELEVDQLVLRNGAKEPLLVLRGQLVIEGEQDRVMSADRIIEPGETTIVGVRCVEKERSEGGLYFRTGKAMAELSLRRAVAHEDQDHVWAQVDVIAVRDKLYSETRSYRPAAQAQTRGDNAARRERIVAALGKMEERAHVLGFAVAVDDELVAFERFASPELHRKLEAELLASYLPATAGTPVAAKKPLAPSDVRAFLASVKPSTTAASTVHLKVRPAREQVLFD